MNMLVWGVVMVVVGLGGVKGGGEKGRRAAVHRVFPTSASPMATRLFQAHHVLQTLARLCSSVNAEDLLNGISRNYGRQLKMYELYNGSSAAETSLRLCSRPSYAISNCSKCLHFATENWTLLGHARKASTNDDIAADPLFYSCRLRELCPLIELETRKVGELMEAAKEVSEGEGGGDGGLGTPRPSTPSCPDWASDLFTTVQGLKHRIAAITPHIRRKVPGAVEWLGDGVEAAEETLEKANAVAKNVLDYLGPLFWLLLVIALAFLVLVLACILRCRVNCAVPCCTVSSKQNQVLSKCPACSTNVYVSVNTPHDY